MKLKSKLIATIVSICAAIAVMGVGVWAATANFTVTVKNKVNISIVNLAGTIKYSTEALVQEKEGDLTKPTGITEIVTTDDASLIYDNDAATVAQDYTIDSSKYNGADLFTSGDDGYISDRTVKATLKYTFAYDAPDTATVGFTNVVITPTTLPQGQGATMTYQYSVNGGAVQTLAQGTAVKLYAAAGVDFTIEIIATYNNPNLVSATVGDADALYQFSVTYTGDSANNGGTPITA